MNDLIDTTEMYLRTLFELREEGVPPMRARIAERLHQSVPTVSQTVARMERDGLVSVDAERHVAMTPAGEAHAVAVMRKHRLAERLLVDVLGLPWAEVHEEACRWEHVMSVTVEKRIVALLGDPVESPYGNLIPGLDEIATRGRDAGERRAPNAVSRDVTSLASLCQDVSSGAGPWTVRLVSIGEFLQTNADLMRELAAIGLSPGVVATVRPDGADLVSLSGPGGSLVMSADDCAQLFVARS